MEFKFIKIEENVDYRKRKLKTQQQNRGAQLKSFNFLGHVILRMQEYKCTEEGRQKIRNDLTSLSTLKIRSPIMHG